MENQFSLRIYTHHFICDGRSGIIILRDFKTPNFTKEYKSQTSIKTGASSLLAFNTLDTSSLDISLKTRSNVQLNSKETLLYSKLQKIMGYSDHSMGTDFASLGNINFKMTAE